MHRRYELTDDLTSSGNRPVVFFLTNPVPLMVGQLAIAYSLTPNCDSAPPLFLGRELQIIVQVCSVTLHRLGGCLHKQLLAVYLYRFCYGAKLPGSQNFDAFLI